MAKIWTTKRLEQFFLVCAKWERKLRIQFERAMFVQQYFSLLSWGCFDEFNRIDISVLSVISTQIQTIRSALMQGLERFVVTLAISLFVNFG